MPPVLKHQQSPPFPLCEGQQRQFNTHSNFVEALFRRTELVELVDVFYLITLDTPKIRMPRWPKPPVAGKGYFAQGSAPNYYLTHA